MTRNLLPFASLSLLALTTATFSVAACSATNGDVVTPPVVEVAPDGGGGEPTPDEDSGTVTPEYDGGTKKDSGKDSGPTTCTPAGDILGTFTSGACCALAAKLTAKTPSIDTNVLTFAAGETFTKASLSPGGQTLFDTANAGGSSFESEVMSYELLRYCEGASLLKTETQIGYAPPDGMGPNTITDILLSIGGQKIGVSVTRAYRPSSIPFPDADVKSLLEDKLAGVNRSSVRVLPADKWVKQILHIFTSNKAQTDAVNRVYPTIDAAIRADTIVLVTETKGGGFVYCNPDPPLGSECP